MSLDPRYTYDLEQLIAAGEPQFFSADPLYYKGLAIKHAEARMGRTLYEGQVEMYMIEVMAYLLQVRGAEQQMAVIQRLLPFATSRHLDLLGARLKTFRLAAARASMTVRFVLAVPRFSTLVVPAGTRVRTAGSDVVFLTDTDLLIAQGSLQGEVAATAELGGALGVSVASGARVSILDPVAGVNEATVRVFSDGAAAEGDDAYRLRIAEAWELISRGGPRAGYRQLAKGAHPAILDVAVIRPQPCDIDIYVLTEDMTLPQAVADAVMAACDPKKKRPEGDEVKVRAARPVSFAPTLRLWIDGDEATLILQAEAMARGVFATWQRMLGARVTTAGVTSPVKQLPGIIEAEIEGYSYTALAASDYAMLASLQVVAETA